MSDWTMEVEFIRLRKDYDALAKALCPSHGELYHSLEPCRVRQVLAQVAIDRKADAMEVFAEGGA